MQQESMTKKEKERKARRREKGDEWRQGKKKEARGGGRERGNGRGGDMYMCKMKNTNGIRKLVAVACRKPAIYVLKRK